MALQKITEVSGYQSEYGFGYNGTAIFQALFATQLPFHSGEVFAKDNHKGKSCQNQWLEMVSGFSGREGLLTAVRNELLSKRIKIA